MKNRCNSKIDSEDESALSRWEAASGRTLVVAIQRHSRNNSPVLRLERDRKGQYWLASRRVNRAQALRWLAEKHFDGESLDAYWGDEGMRQFLTECADLIQAEMDKTASE